MPNSDAAAVNAVKAQVDDAQNSQEGYTIFTNQEVNIQEVVTDAKDRIDLVEIKEDTSKDIMIGLGMPDALLSGSDTYSSSFLKVELLTNEYAKFRTDFATFVENKIFKPISMRRGFVTKDEWGEPVLVYPTIKFDRLSIARGTEDFNLLSQQVDNNRLPVTALVESLGFDAEDVKSQLREEMTSVFNPDIRQMISGTLTNLSNPLAQTRALVDKVADSLAIPELKNQPIPKNEEN
jgi:hypothetical protein